MELRERMSKLVKEIRYEPSASDKQSWQYADQIIALMREIIGKTLLADEEISRALKVYWIDSEACPHCKAIRKGGYLLSPEERDNLVAQTQLQKILELFNP